jgi:hypothetical protein
MSSNADPRAVQAARLERTLKSTVVSSWSELMPESASGLIHVEYQTGADGELDFIKIWASRVWGEWKLVCELWMRPLWSHVSGVRFGGQFHSVDFARTLELMVGNACTTTMLPNLHGLIQVFTPTTIEQNEADAIVREAMANHDATIATPHIAA